MANKSDLTKSPNVTSIQDPQLNAPRGIEIIQGNDGFWHGFILNYTSKDLVRLDFGNSLMNIPSMTNLGNFGLINNSYGLAITHDGTAYKALVLNSNLLIVLDFGNSLTSIPTASTAPIESSSFSLSLYRYQNQWFALSANGSKVIHLSFGNQITSSFTSSPS